jgi:DNA ligase 1
MATIKQVMKGPNEIIPFDHPAIHYPQLASIKMDGFRLLNLCGEYLLSPALKPFPNNNMVGHLQPFLTWCRENRLVTDGEFWSPSRTFQDLQSITRSHNMPIPNDVKYHIFDVMTEEQWDNGTELPFINRYLEYWQTLQGFSNVVCVEQHRVMGPSEAEDFFNTQLSRGQEGMILRSLSAFYKHGRTTLKQDGMWKFKEFVTKDATIIRIEQGEKMRDGIERGIDVLGRAERTYKQADYEPSGMVGAFVVLQDGVEFKVKPGKGHDNALKIRWWEDYCRYPEKWRGKHIEYKFMPHGTMDKPRIGNLVRFRPDLD